MGARADGADDLVRLRRREDELDVRRRLLDDLQQRVEALRRDHVRLVEDEDLVAVPRGRERRALAQLTGVVDAAVARRVDLDDVEAARAAARQLDARVAHAARGVGRVPSVFCAQLRMRARMRARRRLAAAARAGEQVRVVDLAAAQRLPQRRGDVVLADHLGEGLGPVAAVQGCRHATNPRRPRRQARERHPQPTQSARTTVSASTDRSSGREVSVAANTSAQPPARNATSMSGPCGDDTAASPSSGKNMTSAVDRRPDRDEQQRHQHGAPADGVVQLDGRPGQVLQRDLPPPVEHGRGLRDARGDGREQERDDQRDHRAGHQVVHEDRALRVLRRVDRGDRRQRPRAPRRRTRRAPARRPPATRPSGRRAADARRAAGRASSRGAAAPCRRARAPTARRR